MLVRLLMAVEDTALRRRLSRLGGPPNVLVQTLEEGRSLWEALADDSADLVLADRGAVGPTPAELVRSLRRLPDAPELIVLLSSEEGPERMALLGAGCFAVLAADQPDEVLATALAGVVRRHREAGIARLAARGREHRYQLTDFESASPAMTSVLRVARRVAESDSSLLILGETGVGKEWLARAIHQEGARAGAPFIAVNMAALPEPLLESELFGHEKGAFTGAAGSRRGCFELAHRGTIFLDEIGDMPHHLQARLLRVLEERKIQRLGSERPIEVDVRVMAATNRDLGEAMAAKEFRSDLYYRLGVVSLTLPPLRQRQEDIPQLVETYRERFRLRLGRPVEEVEPVAMAALTAYSWPGNVRELINVMERAVLLAEGGALTLADLPDGVKAMAVDGEGRPGAAGPVLPVGWQDRSLKDLRREVLESLERAYLDEQLRAAGGRVGKAAERAGLTPRGLHQKMRAHGLRKEDYRD